jgi:hypothetical protein
MQSEECLAVREFGSQQFFDPFQTVVERLTLDVERASSLRFAATVVAIRDKSRK